MRITIKVLTSKSYLFKEIKGALLAGRAISDAVDDERLLYRPSDGAP
jgi:hypothetical protein